MNIRTAVWIVSMAACLTPGLETKALGYTPPPDYEHFWQEATSGRATFRVEGPATGSYPDVQGDALLTEVEMPTGETFRLFSKPVDVRNLYYSGDRTRFRVRGGTRTTIGVQGDYYFPNVDMDGPMDESDLAAVDQFRLRLLDALRNNNLNNYADISSSTVRFSFVLKFNLVIKDNDPEADDFGELLYFERGTGNGNSWLKMRAVDENSAPLGPWLVIGPTETVQTTPMTTVYRSDQKMGTTAVDVSRLGVTEVQYIELSNDVPVEPAYTGGGDLNPDFKLMAVITNEEQLQEVLGIFD